MEHKGGPKRGHRRIRPLQADRRPRHLRPTIDEGTPIRIGGVGPIEVNPL
jgi:hypothetical protein